MNATLPNLLFVAGAGQLCVLVASALVPIRLRWREAFQPLGTLHRQLYWVYGGYTVMSIIALGTITAINAQELAAGSLLARSFAAYAGVFWGVRLLLQGVLDVREHLTAWWLKLGYYALTVLFAAFTTIFWWTALHPAG